MHASNGKARKNNFAVSPTRARGVRICCCLSVFIKQIDGVISNAFSEVYRDNFVSFTVIALARVIKIREAPSRNADSCSQNGCSRNAIPDVGYTFLLLVISHHYCRNNTNEIYRNIRCDADIKKYGMRNYRYTPRDD